MSNLNKFIPIVILFAASCQSRILPTNEPQSIDQKSVQTENNKTDKEVYTNPKVLIARVTNADKSFSNEETVKRYQQNQVVLDIKTKLMLDINSKLPITGILNSYSADGNFLLEHNYKNGKREGYVRIYYETGILKLESNVKNDELDGLTRWHSKNGALEAEENYKDGKREGLVRIYYENGVLKGEINYKNGILEGFFRTYSENGALVSEISYKNGLKNGQSELYLEDGKLCVSVVYKNGFPISGKNSIGRKLTHAELLNYSNGVKIYCNE